MSLPDHSNPTLPLNYLRPARHPRHSPFSLWVLFASLFLPPQATLALQATPGVGPSIFSLLPAERPLIRHSDIAAGLTVPGDLTASNYVLATEARFAAYRVELLADTAYHLTLNSPFDSFLLIASPAPSLVDASTLPNIDERGTDFCFVPPATANYIVVVGATYDDTGSFTFRLTRGCNDTPADLHGVLSTLDIPANHRLSVGFEMEGQLTPNAPQWDDKPVQGWLLSAFAGDTIAITLTSDAFDPFLAVIDPTGQLVADDDGGPGLNARVVLAAPIQGSYRIFVTSFSGGTGSFRIAVLRFRQSQL